MNDELRNDLLFRALDPGLYHLKPHESVVQLGFDLAGFNRLADELEDTGILDKTSQP